MGVLVHSALSEFQQLNRVANYLNGKRKATMGEHMPDDEPGLVKFSESIADTENPVQAAKYADLFLLCMACVGTVLGSLIGCGMYVHVFVNALRPDFPWLAALLVSVALGGASGCAIVMRILHARQLIGWESREEKSNK